jgi:hypothetical protein
VRMHKKRTPAPARPVRDMLAVPLTPAEMQLLINALDEDDRLMRLHHYPDGSAFARSEAAMMLARAGMAAALGHRVIPVLIRELGMYEHVLGGLRRFAPDGQITRDFAQLLGRMHALSGQAQVHRWETEVAGGGLRWKGTPPGQLPPAVAQAPELPRGKRGRR